MFIASENYPAGLKRSRNAQRHMYRPCSSSRPKRVLAPISIRDSKHRSQIARQIPQRRCASVAHGVATCEPHSGFQDRVLVKPSAGDSYLYSGGDDDGDGQDPQLDAGEARVSNVHYLPPLRHDCNLIMNLSSLSPTSRLLCVTQFPKGARRGTVASAETADRMEHPISAGCNRFSLGL